jgi:hypothetical protein
VGLERGPLSLVKTVEELLGINSSGFGLERREYDRGDPLRWPRDTTLSVKVGTNFGGCSVGTVRSLTKAPEFIVFG